MPATLGPEWGRVEERNTAPERVSRAARGEQGGRNVHHSESPRSSLKFTMSSRKATLAADALQIYSIIKGLARDPGSAGIASFVANLKRDLGRRGRPKGSVAAAKPSPGPIITTAVEEKEK